MRTTNGGGADMRLLEPGFEFYIEFSIHSNLALNFVSSFLLVCSMQYVNNNFNSNIGTSVITRYLVGRCRSILC